MMKEIATEHTKDEERVTMPWTAHRPRKKKTGYYGTLRHCHVLVALLAVVVVPRGHIHVTAECSAHGCSLTALDIVYDESTRAALDILRPSEARADGDDDDYDDDGDYDGEDDGDDNGDDNGDEVGVDSDSRGKALSALQGAGDNSKTTLTLRGYKGGKMEDQINQDRAMIVSPFHVLPDSSSSPIVAQLLGVFDGHGNKGEVTSQYAIERIPSLLASKLASIADGYEESKVVEALKQTFDEVDKNDPSKGNGGCTATVVLRLGQKLFIANAGDSVSFVGVYIDGGQPLSNPSGKDVQIVFQSREDTPDLPEEKARILAAGGHVEIPSDDDDVPRAYSLDENKKPTHGLAMSRSLGDWDFLGVIAEPIVDVLDLSEIVEKALASYTESCSKDVDNTENTNESDRYCEFKDSSNIHIFAASVSDGMMDYLSPENIGKTLATAFFEKDSNFHPHSAAEKLIIEAAMGWENEFRGGYRDDIAIASFVVPHL